MGGLAAQYLKGDGRGGGGGGVGTVVGLFVKLLFKAMGEPNKGVQAGAVVCMAKMVECGGGGGGGEAVPVAAFQKLCLRICKLLNSPVSEPYWSCIEAVSSLRKPYLSHIPTVSCILKNKK